MQTLTNLITNFGDLIELDFDTWDLDNAVAVLNQHSGWVQYNPRKLINRKGLSVTSLDGGYSGVPDLDSLREYNILNNKAYNEGHFKKRTDIVDSIPELNLLLDTFSDHGRCHFLRLDSGGYFPPHRDNGLSNAAPSTFRIIVPIHNFHRNQLIWVQEDEILNFELGRAYFVNTSKVHSLFSFVDNSLCLVMNVMASPGSIENILKHCAVK